MSENTKYERTFWIHAVTPLHVGTGRGIGYIDLPIAREKVTNWPYIPGSAIKGVVANNFGASDVEERKKDPMLKAAFGITGESSTDEANSTAGSLIFTDARMVCLPIRSFYGTFAWVTSPFCLKRLARDLKIAVPAVDDKITALTTTSTKLLGSEKSNTKIYLEDLDISTTKDPTADNVADVIASCVFPDDDWRNIFKERFVIISDDIFTFLCEAGTEVNARIRIDEKTGIVAKGALWYEESLPVETILAGTVWCDCVYTKDKSVTKDLLLKKYCEEPLDLQIGGKASVGKGQIRCIFNVKE